MLTYRVDVMRCGHCAGAITQAVRAVDADAKVRVDLSRHLMTIEPTASNATDLAQAIAGAGYAPVLVELAAASKSTPGKGGCCGCCG
ncbi:MAG TPA: heavy-metal-associated domain-containing protein [Roseateles sp.]